jgi:hypothetical protein
MDAVQEEEAPYWVAGESVMTESPRRFSVFFLAVSIFVVEATSD